MGERAVCICFAGDRLLVMRRVKDGRRYTVLPGGGIEPGETAAEAAVRELREETGLRGAIVRSLGSFPHAGRTAHFFLMRAETGELRLGGPEAAQQSAANQYLPAWIPADVWEAEPIVPAEARAVILRAYAEVSAGTRGKAMGEKRSISVHDGVVSRPVKPWSSTVQSLLRHLHREGLPVPEPLGFDDRFEYVGFVRGDAGDDAWPHQTSTAAVASAGRLLRRMHDATLSWRAPSDAVWAVRPEGGQVICHGDPQPANFAWAGGTAIGLFDWDVARPADRISDIAYALEWFVPFVVDTAELGRRGFTGPIDRDARIDAFLEGYGWDAPLAVVDAVLARQRRAIDEVVWLGQDGHEPQASWVASGWPERWNTKLGDTESRRDTIGRIGRG